MSLDIFLTRKKWVSYDGGKTHTVEDETVYEANITHNLAAMADKAGLYKYLWRPEELGINKAKELVEPLTKGLADMKARPKYYKKFNASNGWGLYKHFVPWIERYLEAAKEYPDANIEVGR